MCKLETKLYQDFQARVRLFLAAWQIISMIFYEEIFNKTRLSSAFRFSVELKMTKMNLERAVLFSVYAAVQKRYNRKSWTNFFFLFLEKNQFINIFRGSIKFQWYWLQNDFYNFIFDSDRIGVWKWSKNSLFLITIQLRNW